jgi:hypothetical protein
MSYKRRSDPLIVIFLFLITGQHAFAYLDPGTGSYMLQLTIAFLVGVLFWVKLYWKKIAAFLRTALFKKKKGDDKAL